MTNLGFVRCAIANFVGRLGNVSYNVEKLKEQIDKAEQENVKLLVLPELCLTGYSCQDLFTMNDLLIDSYEGLNEIIKHTNLNDVLVIIGAPIFNDYALYNCAIVIYDGKVLGIVPKQYIPTDEKKWFSSFNNSLIKIEDFFNETIPFGNDILFRSNLGYTLGIEISEDLSAVIPPSSYMSLAGADVIVNLAASNELVGKNNYRRELIKNQSARTISAYLYTSAGFSESTADTVYGGSGYAFENGKELAHLTRFLNHDQMKIFDIDVDYLYNERRCNKTFIASKKEVMKNYFVVEFSQINDRDDKLLRKVNPYPLAQKFSNDDESKNCAEIFNIQTFALARRLTSIGNTKVILGISGGLDSTLALLVCYNTFKDMRLDTKDIICVTMPGFGTTDRTKNNAFKLCEALGTTLIEIPIRDACIQHFKDIGHDISVHDITYENVQARERTQILMDMANKHHALLIGTGDLSEGVLGWCTFNGDHMSMYNVNCSIPKTCVKSLIEYYLNCVPNTSVICNILYDIIETPISPELLPTDGKKVVQETENAVGPYEVIDFFIYHLLRNKFSKEKIVFLAEHAFGKKYTHEQLVEYYNKFIKRFFRNQFKRNCVPDGPKVGSVSLSPRGDWKMPSDADVSNWLVKE